MGRIRLAPRRKWYFIRSCVGILVFFAILGFGTNTFAFEAQPALESANSSRVVIISMPRISWDRLEVADTPHIDNLISKGSVANLSIRVPGSEKTVEKGYATISAGSRNFAVSSTYSTFFHPNEEVIGNSAGDTFRDERQMPSNNYDGVSLGFELTAKSKPNVLSSSRVGSLAQMLSKDNRTIAVFGNADYCSNDEWRCFNRAVGYVGVDEQGVITHGDVSRDLLNKNGNIDFDTLTKKTIRSLSKNDVTVSECSDLERIDFSATRMTQSELDIQLKKAIHECDSFIGKVAQELDLSNDRIFVISPMSQRSIEELTIFIAAGKEIPKGFSASGITRREGIVALADIAPSILAFYGIEPPENMVDTSIGYQRDDSSFEARISELKRINAGALARDGAFNSVSIVFILLVCVAGALSIVCYKTKRYKPIAKYLALLSMVMPTVSFLLLPMMLWLETSRLIVMAFVLFSAIFSAIAFVAGQRWGYKTVILVIVAFNIIMQCLDILFGGYFQLNSLFGYSAIVAGRFAGYGNLTFSIISISAVVFVAVVKQIALEKGGNQKRINIFLSLFLIAILIFIGIPYLGSDVGGVLAMTPTICIAVLMLYEKRINVKSLLYACATTFVAISIFSIFDLSRPTSQRTHLGRFVYVLINGDAGAVIERKIISNVTIFTNAMVACIIIIATLFLLFLFMYPERFIAERKTRYPVFAFIAYPGIVVATLGMFLNDSGVAIPGMMLAIAFPALALLAYENEQQSQHDTTLVRTNR